MLRLNELLQAACARYAARPVRLLSAPRPYPGMARLGLKLMKAGPYWLAFAKGGDGPVVARVLHEGADMAGRGGGR